MSLRAPKDDGRKGPATGRHIVLLTGGPGVGKTDVCRRTAELAKLRGLRVCGLVTEARARSSGRIMQTVVNLRTGDRRRLADYVGTEEGDPYGAGVAGRLSWTFSSDALRWGRNELERCGALETDLFIIDQIGPLELVTGSGWANAVDVLSRAPFKTAVVVVNPLVTEQLARSLDSPSVVIVDVDERTREALPEHLIAMVSRPAGSSALLIRGGPDLVVADLDGTLLGADGDPSPGVGAAVGALQDTGATVVICTGRPTEYALDKAKRLGAAGPVVSYGGAEVVDVDGAVLSRAPLPVKTLRKALELSASLGLASAARDSPVGVLRLVLKGPASKLDQVGRVLAAGAEAAALLRPSPDALAVQNACATKLEAVVTLAERLGVKRSHLAYIGDAADDVPALAWAGLGVGVGGPACEVAEAADIVTPQDQLAALMLRLALARRLRPVA